MLNICCIWNVVETISYPNLNKNKTITNDALFYTLHYSLGENKGWGGDI